MKIKTQTIKCHTKKIISCTKTIFICPVTENKVDIVTKKTGNVCIM